MFLLRARALRPDRHDAPARSSPRCLQLLAHAALPLQLQLFPGYGPWIIGIQAVSLVFETSTSYLLSRTLRRAPSCATARPAVRVDLPRDATPLLT